MKFQKLTLKKKFQNPASILEHKTNLAVNTLTIPYVQWWGRVKWLMGYWQVKLYQSQVNLLKIFFDFETNPVRVDKSGLHRKKSTFRLFSLAAYDSPLKKTPKKSKNARWYMSKKEPVWNLLSLGVSDPISYLVIWNCTFLTRMAHREVAVLSMVFHYHTKDLASPFAN